LCTLCFVFKNLFLILSFSKRGEGRQEISRNSASKLTWTLHGSERTVMRIICVSGKEAGTDGVWIRKKYLPLSGF
jgi:hypothetical protein